MSSTSIATPGAKVSCAFTNASDTCYKKGITIRLLENKLSSKGTMVKSENPDIFTSITGDNMDNYNQLLAFIWAYEYGNFSSAARANGLTPSAMSKLISRLEARLKVRLFHRGTRTLTLTEEGLVYLKSARAVVDAMTEADSLAEDMPSRISGQLKIRTMTTFARYHILPWLPSLLPYFWPSAVCTQSPRLFSSYPLCWKGLPMGQYLSGLPLSLIWSPDRVNDII